MMLEAEFEGEVWRYRTCDESECPNVSFEIADRPTIDFEWLEMSPEDWAEERGQKIDEILNSLGNFVDQQFSDSSIH